MEAPLSTSAGAPFAKCTPIPKAKVTPLPPPRTPPTAPSRHTKRRRPAALRFERSALIFGCFAIGSQLTND